MNEEVDGTNVPQMQNQVATPQPDQPISAVNAGFDASKLGNGQRPEKKPKRVKSKKQKATQDMLPQRESVRKNDKRPVWFWIVLGILGVAVVGAIAWMIIMLVKLDDGIPTELILEGKNGKESVEGGDVNEYVRQLRIISGLDTVDDSTTNNGAGGGSTGNSQGNSQARTVEDGRKAASSALESSNGQQYRNEIILAEAILLFSNRQYNEAIDTIMQVNPDELNADNKLSYYAVLQMSYGALGNTAESQRYLQIQQATTLEIYNGRGN